MPSDLALDVAFSNVGALIPEFLAAGETELHLYQAACEVEAQRNDRQAFFGDATLQPDDFVLMQEQLARPRRFGIRVAPLLIRLNVHSHEPRFPVAKTRVRFAQARTAATNCLHFRAGQDQAGLQRLEDVKFVTRSAILDRRGVLGHACRSGLRRSSAASSLPRETKLPSA